MGITDFFSVPRIGVVPTIIQFPPVDTDGEIKRLKLKERAKEQGAKNLPPADLDALDPVENDIIAEIMNLGKEQYDAYLEQQKTYSERATDTSVEALVLKVESTVNKAVAEFERETHVGRGALYAKKRDVIQTERALNDFRLEHKLRRPPRNYGSRAFKYSVLALILAIEAVLNGFFLSTGSEFGFVGGVFQALLIAALNIALGVIAGRFVAPWLAYRNNGARLLAAVGVIVYLGGAFGFNLAVAHYRTAMAGDPFESSVNAYRQLVSAPFVIEDLECWALFVMGFLFSLFAAYDGWLMDDPYPGYGRMMRHNLQALDDYTELKEYLIRDLDKIKTEAEDGMDNLCRSITSRHGEFENICQRSAALRAAMSEHFEHLQSAANRLLAFYRNENQKFRQGLLPARFRESATWSYPIPTLEEVIDRAGGDAIKDAMRRALAEISQRRDAMYKGYKKALDQYQKIDDLVDLDGMP